MVRPRRARPDHPAAARHPDAGAGRADPLAGRGAYKQLAFSNPRAAQRQVVEAFAGHHGSRANVAALLESGRRLLPELAVAPFDLAAIACPVLLVWGTQDRMVPHSGARVVLGALPETRVELIEGCGHCPQLEATAELLALLLAFPNL